MILITFYSVSGALLLDMVLKKRGVACSVIPVPRELSSSCGYAVEIEAHDGAPLTSLMDDGEIEWEAVYGYDENRYFLMHQSSR